MKLRNFLYLNTKILEDYISAIDGYTYDEESQAIATSKESSGNGGLNVKAIEIGGAHSGKRTEEVTRSVKIGDAAKFDKVYKYLQSDEDESLQYYEFLTEETYDALSRDDFIEVLATARFSKAKELTDSVKRIGELANLIQGFTDQQILDKKTADAIEGISALGKLNAGKEISCVFSFDDGKYPMVAYLDSSYFRCEQENFVGQAYVLCKIIRKVPKGQSIKLDEIFEDIKKMPLNRDQRRKMPKNMDNPEMMRDVIKGPALVVTPIAVYQ